MHSSHSQPGGFVSSRVLVVFHSGSGSVEQLALAVEAGARAAGATTRLRRAGGGPDGPAGKPTGVPTATADDALWAHVIAVGTPTHFGNISAEVLRFLERCHGAASAGMLADKMVTGFTAASSANGGQESVLLALHRAVAGWGALALPTGYTDSAFRGAGGNPYGLSVTTGPDGPLDPAGAAAAGRALGKRAVALADRYIDALAAAL